jgi:exopolyphosphatase/guanosine-5'-triphosphate,3'-diphosphate pyrophosphatase
VAYDGAVLDLASPLPESVAAVDLGSNSFHLIVARINAGELVVVDRLREMVQLAAGLDRKRRLDDDARSRALECLQRFGERVRHMPAGTVRAVGTNTLRSAHDTDEFLLAAEEALGHPIETISGMEEARLIYLGVAHSLANRGAKRLVVDIGGGSTELIIGEDFRPLLMESLYLGCVTTSRRFFGDGSIDAKRWRKAELAALQELEGVQTRYRDAGWEEAVGASGTIRSVAAVVRAAGWSKRGISAKALRRLRDAMVEAGHVDHLGFEGLNPARRAVFPGGVAMLAALFESLGIDRMLPAEGALREGLLNDLVGRIRREDVRGRSVRALADRYHVDWKQAHRVEHTARQLLVQVGESFGLASVEPRQLLSWAAQLHEIGLDIAHQHYHRHGEYIIAQSDLHGFSREEQRVLALLVRAHRRKFPGSLFAELPRRRTKQAERLAILLRLSVLLHRSRSPDDPPEPSLTVEKRSLELGFPEGWLEQHPLTHADLEQERTYLKGAGYRLGLA